MLTIAVALARDRLPLSETRDVDVLLRPCLLFVSFFCFVWVEGRRHVERRRGVVKGREREAGERACEGERNQEKRKKMSACGLFLLDLSRAPPYLGTGTGRSGPPSPSPSRCGRRRAAVAAAVARRRRKQQQRGRRGGLLRRPWAWEAATPMTLRQLPAPKREPRRSASKPSLVSLSWGRRCLPRLQEGATAASCPRRERERERERERGREERTKRCLPFPSNCVEDGEIIFFSFFFPSCSQRPQATL
jgi:hypothetical protein